KYGGTGLGLAIVSNLLKIHGSEIRVASEPGNGSSFTFAIDFTKAGTPDLKPGSRPQFAEVAAGFGMA
ncbi:MAG TPA: ATP-binding protein, partial [Sphingobacteriaceae bacterium]